MSDRVCKFDLATLQLHPYQASKNFPSKWPKCISRLDAEEWCGTTEVWAHGGRPVCALRLSGSVPKVWSSCRIFVYCDGCCFISFLTACQFVAAWLTLP